MKKMIVLVGLILSVTTVSASELIKMPVLELLPTELDHAVEIKTTKFEQVILDCQSLISGMTFSEKGEIVNDVKLDMFMCEQVMNFLLESRRDSLPVCIGLNADRKELVFTRETDECI